MSILSGIEFPEQISKLNDNQLIELSAELREFLIKNVSKTGGHLAPNLGVVELTVSLYNVFNFKEDKVVWDVGHQAYVHKILTGRKESFESLRKFNGISGFPKSSESDYDMFNTGHSSTSISAALGMARARDIKKEDNKVIAVIGDGALGGGMALEALNDLGYNNTPMIVVLNDNAMSISKNVGGISLYLNKLRTEPAYKKLKSEINKSGSYSKFGKVVVGSLSKVKGTIKQFVMPGMLFENMGIKYLGPVDGHNIKELKQYLKIASNINGPVLVHVITQKGKGYDYAEQKPHVFHGIGPFDYSSGECETSSKLSYSRAFGDALTKIAEKDDKVVAITAAMKDGTGLGQYCKLFPERFFDVGIAEQHAVTLACGMAKEGLKPVFAVYSTFLQRAYDQILHDMCIQNLPVVLGIDRAGLVGEDGETHQGIFDISFLSHIPNMTIMAPKCIKELDYMVDYAVNFGGPIAIRYPRGGDSYNNFIPLKKYTLGKWETVCKGQTVAIIASGKMLATAMEVKDLLEYNSINVEVINSVFIKPIDTECIDKLIKRNMTIVTIEDNIINGGLGDAILQYINNSKSNIKVLNIGFEDEFVAQGKVTELHEAYGLDKHSIQQKILRFVTE